MESYEAAKQAFGLTQPKNANATRIGLHVKEA